jgi:hypothetical protein
MDGVMRLANTWARQFTPDVMHAMRMSATSVGLPGASADRKLWLQYIEEWAEKQEHTGPDGGPLIIVRAPNGGSAPTPPR